MKASIGTFPSVSASGSHLAAWAAALCGVHCALTPLLIVAMPALALSEGVERGVFVGTLVLGGLMLLMGARAHASILSAFAGGAGLWALSLAGLLEPWPESVTSSIGSLVLAGALFASVRICRTEACAICAEAEGGRGVPRATGSRPG